MSSERCHITVTEVGGEIVVRFITILMRYSSDSIDDIGQELDSLLAQYPSRSLILDFEGKEFFFRWDFVARLVSLHKKASQADAIIKLCDLPPHAIQRVKTSRLIGFFAISKSLDDGLAGKVLDPD